MFAYKALYYCESVYATKLIDFNFAVCTLDLVFVVDSSFNLDATSWSYLVNFTISLAQYHLIGPTTTNIGYLTYGFNPNPRFYLNTYSTSAQIIQAIRNIPFSGDWSNLASALTYMQNVMYTSANGDRYWIPNVAVVLSAVEPNQGGSPVSAALAAKAAGTTIYSVGITQTGANRNYMYNISSSPQVQNANWYMVPTFQQLSSIVGTLQAQMCPSNCDCECSRQFSTFFI